MIGHVIIASMAILSAALLISAIRVRNIIKHADPDRIRAHLFLRYDIFKRTTLFFIDGSIIVFFVQVMNILIGIRDLNLIHHQVMLVASVMSMLVIGYYFVHINHMMGIHVEQRRSELERWIYGDDRR